MVDEPYKIMFKRMPEQAHGKTWLVQYGEAGKGQAIVAFQGPRATCAEALLIAALLMHDTLPEPGIDLHFYGEPPEILHHPKAKKIFARMEKEWKETQKDR